MEKWHAPPGIKKKDKNTRLFPFVVKVLISHESQWSHPAPSAFRYGFSNK